MEEAITVLHAAAMAMAVGAAIFTGIDVFPALGTARGRKPKYSDAGYETEYGTKFCRAHFVCKPDKAESKAPYPVEIHPKDAAKARARTVPEEEMRGWRLLEKGRFYKYAFKEELFYD